MSNTASPNEPLTRQIEATVLKYCALWSVEEIQDDVTVLFSSRLTRSLGKTQPVRKVIRLNTQLCTTLNPYLEEVICHELAHVVATHLYGPSIRPHGEEWKALMRSAGFEPNVRLHVANHFTKRKPQRKFRHYCPVCQSERMSRTRMTRWRCEACVADGLSGELQIEEIT